MDRSGVTVSGMLMTDPVADMTDTGSVAMFIMAGGDVVLPANRDTDGEVDGEMVG
jgi:hypothetical protein